MAAIVAAPDIVAQGRALPTRQAIFFMESVGPVDRAGGGDTRPREMLGRVERRAGDPRMEHGKAGEAEPVRIAGQLRVDEQRRPRRREMLSAGLARLGGKRRRQ